MSASRSFIDVLVGKLTAYVDAPSRPTSDPSAVIATPWGVAALDPLPATGGAVARAYGEHAGSAGPSEHAAGASRLADAVPPSAATFGSEHADRVRPRTPAQRTAIQLLQRLGATDVHQASSDEQLRSACRRLLRACHPDAHPGLSEADRAVLSGRVRAVLQVRAVLDLPPVAAGPAGYVSSDVAA